MNPFFIQAGIEGVKTDVEGEINRVYRKKTSFYNVNISFEKPEENYLQTRTNKKQ